MTMPSRSGVRRALSTACAVASIATSLAGAARADTPLAAPIAQLGTTTLTDADLPDAARAHIAKVVADQERRRRESDMEAALALYDARYADATRLLNDRALALEAAKRHSTSEKLLEAVPFAHTTPAEARRLYDEHARQIQQPYEAVAQAILTEMDRQHREAAQADYLAGLRDRYQARVLIDPPRFDVAADGPAQGPVAAPVTMILFADFQCPYCVRMVPVLREVIAHRPADVRLVYRHLPLTELHPLALGAARAAVCVERQGKFWPFYDELFADQARLSPEALRDTASKLGVDATAYDTCLAGEDVAARISGDVAAADLLGLSGTPVLFVNGRMLRGLQTAATVTAVVDDELARRRAAR